jgi:large subunit ribosomal protein L16
MSGVDEGLASEAFTLAAAKLPVATAIVKRTVM